MSAGTLYRVGHKKPNLFERW